MTTEILTILISILATVITALISAFSIIYKDRKLQRQTKHKTEKELEELKKNYYKDIEKLKAIEHLIFNINSTQPTEMLKTLKETIQD